MADCPASPVTIDPNFKQPESNDPNRKPDTPSTSTSQPEQQQQQQPSIINPNPSPNPNQTPAPASLPPAPVQSFAPPTQPISYRPVPMSTASQFSPVQNYQSPVVQPPGVGGVAVTMAPPMMQYPGVPGQPPNPALRPYAPIPNGYGAVPAPASGLPRYPAPYPSMVRPVFPPRPPGPVGVLPSVARPPVPGIPGVRPIMPPVVRPVPLPTVTPAEKPQTKVYVGKIAPTADSDFVLSVLKVCGTVKSWKRAQYPSNGTPKGFGFCEFESAEGVLRALRLLNNFNIDGQELMLKVDQATREYLERYVDRKTENTKKLKETQDAGAGKEDESVQSVEKNEPTKAPENLKDNETGNKESHDPTNFGVVTEEDRKADQEALEKLTCMVEERLKTNPLPPPPPPTTADGSGISNSELPAKARDGDSDVGMIRNDIAEDKLDDETTSDTKASDHDRPETSSPDRSRVHDRRGRDKERDLKREKEREIDRYEREAERERVRKEREQRRKIEEAEREYERCLKDWEYREREREKERQYEKEKEKERERKRKKEILYDEEEDEDDSRKRWRRSVLEEKRRKRIREKEEDLADEVREEEEIAVAKRRAEEEQLQQQQRDALKLLSDNAVNGSLAEESAVESKGMDVEHDYHDDSIRENHMAGDPSLQNGNGDESTNVPIAASDMRQSGNVPARKLGFGLVGSGKRMAVPSVFHVEDDDDADKDKKMRPLVPIDYSTEELQAAQPHVSGVNPPNLAAAAEFAKRISNVNSKEEKSDAERERSRRLHDKSSQREKDRSDEDNNRTRDEHKEKILDRDRDREHGLDKVKTPDNKKLLDAKQLIDMIPKTKEELFSYEINWAVYDKHELHERMRPWISKKITEFLGEEETTLVDYIVSSTQDHVKASQMLELLQTILDDEAEMFVLKMWRMLIFEIKKVETGLALRSKS